MKLFSDKYKSGEKALSHEEYPKLISVITEPEDLLLIKLAVATGLRREDLCNIKLSNIDFKNMLLTFHEAKKDRKEHINKKGRKIAAFTMIRSIPISQQVKIEIERYMNSIDKNKRKHMEDTDRLFTFCGRTAYNRFNYWCRVAGIDERPFHSLRATCIKFYHDAGWKDEAIAKLTGDTIAVIQAHYMVPSNDEMRMLVNQKEII